MDDPVEEGRRLGGVDVADDRQQNGGGAEFATGDRFLVEAWSGVTGGFWPRA